MSRPSYAADVAITAHEGLAHACYRYDLHFIVTVFCLIDLLAGRRRRWVKDRGIYPLSIIEVPHFGGTG
jgi:hypothetical protein